MSNDAATLSLVEKQVLLKQVLEARPRRACQVRPRPRTPSGPPRDDTPASFFNIDAFPRYRQMQLHRELADRLGLTSPFFTLHEGVGRDTTVIAGRDCINFSTYNYLGLNGDPRVTRAAAEGDGAFRHLRLVEPHCRRRAAAASRAGTRASRGCMGPKTRWLSSAATWPTCSIVSTLAGAKDAVVMDRAIHNSVAQGAKLSGAVIHTFPHNDWRALDTLLTGIRQRYERVLIVVEGLYSMEGRHLSA